MAKFIVRRLLSMLVTMCIVSIIVFLVAEAVPGDVARHILGPFADPEQVTLFRRQLGLTRPLYVRYIEWLVGTDWRAEKLTGMSVVRIRDPRTGTLSWWAVDTDGVPKRWKMVDGGLMLYRLMPDGTLESSPAGDVWRADQHGNSIFWGLDTANHVVLWKKGVVEEEVGPDLSGRPIVEQAGGIEYIPLQRGLLRGDPGMSTRTNRPVADTVFRRLRNSIILAAISFAAIMPLALVLGLVAGANEGTLIDRVLSISGLATAASPDFATGILLILILAVWWKLVPGATVFGTENALFQNPEMLILPVLTLTLIDLGYMLRITRASMVEVMGTAYIRMAYLKGLPQWQVIFKHALPNALMAPITVMMLHINWLIGRIVVVEALFGFPGLGSYLLESALFKDVFAIEAGAMLMVMIAVGTQLAADVIYTFLNPRIRYT